MTYKGTTDDDGIPSIHSNAARAGPGAVQHAGQDVFVVRPAGGGRVPATGAVLCAYAGSGGAGSVAAKRGSGRAVRGGERDTACGVPVLGPHADRGGVDGTRDVGGGAVGAVVAAAERDGGGGARGGVVEVEHCEFEAAGRGRSGVGERVYAGVVER